MFKSVNRISVLKCLTNDGLTFSPRTTGWIQIYRCSSGIMPEKAEEAVDISYEMNFSSFLQQRQEQARRSFFAKAQTLEDCEKLLTLCKSCGDIRKAFHCEQQDVHFILVEMYKSKSLSSITQKMPQNFGSTNRAIVFNKNNSHILEDITTKGSNNPSFITVSSISSKKLLNTELSKRANDLSNVIKKCYDCLRLNEFEIRKKFLTCIQIEDLCKGFLPGTIAIPFGSSISGFGINGCDLDIALLPAEGVDILKDIENNNASLVEISRKHLGIISDILKVFTMWTSDVFYIKNARVPIVKFKNNVTNVECDLSMYNSHGVAMSQMLYILSSFDWRVKALVIFIKLWSQKVGIVNKFPGSKLSSFSVAALVLFFLQQIQMVPPLNIFPCKDSQYLLKKDELISESILLREKQKSSSNSSNNNKSVEELFKMFFEYYNTFDFSKWGISLKEGKAFKNIDRYPLFIENPIYPGVNVSGNVKNFDILEVKDVISEVLNILETKSDLDQVRRIFSLSTKRKGKMDES